MGVVRSYKSTGDMLNASANELALYERQSKEEDEDEDEEEDSGTDERHVMLESGQRNQNEDRKESQRWRNGHATTKSNNNSRWNSCKLFGSSNGYNNTSANYKSESHKHNYHQDYYHLYFEEAPKALVSNIAIETRNKWPTVTSRKPKSSGQSKSVADILALGLQRLQQQQQQQPDNQCPQTRDRKLQNRERTESKLKATDEQLAGLVSRVGQVSYGEKSSWPTAPVDVVLVKRKPVTELNSINATNFANGHSKQQARQRRASKMMKQHSRQARHFNRNNKSYSQSKQQLSSSLSSPSLTHQQRQPFVCPSSGVGQTAAAAATTADQRLFGREDNNDGSSMLLLQVDLTHTPETKATNVDFSQSEASNGDESRQVRQSHCFVDVARLELHTQRLPVRGNQPNQSSSEQTVSLAYERHADAAKGHVCSATSQSLASATLVARPTTFNDNGKLFYGYEDENVKEKDNQDNDERPVSGSQASVVAAKLANPSNIALDLASLNSYIGSAQRNEFVEPSHCGPTEQHLAGSAASAGAGADLGARGPNSGVSANVTTIGHQQQGTDKTKIQETKSQIPSRTTTSANKLMVDLNNTAEKLVGSCRSSWRQALGATSSGSYKVDQHVSGLLDQVSGGELQQQQEAGEAGNVQQQQATNSSDTQATYRDRRIARYSRPGRSPISLQRQTNARLTRHKLKIQQQRQEQLAQLAIRERNLLSNHQYYQQQQQQQQQLDSEQPTPIASLSERVSNSVYSNRESLDLGRWGGQISATEEGEEDRRGSLSSTRSARVSQVNTNDLELLYLRNGLFDRLPLARDKYSGRQRSASHNGSGGPTSETTTAKSTRFIQSQHQTRLGLPNADLEQGSYQLNSNNYNRQQPQVISPASVLGAVEICDNQLACSSRQGSRDSTLTNSKRFSATGNVIVYRSINMLRNSNLNSEMNQHQQHPQYGKSGGRNHSESIDTEDTQTISSCESTISLNKPFCKICHIGSTKNGDKLISPCKCSGTMQYIHCGCLLKWLEISNRTNEKPMSCELCAHEYTWHKKFNYRQVRLPKCSLKDVFLHTIFVTAIGVMLMAVLTPMFEGKSSQVASSNNIPPTPNSQVSNNQPGAGSRRHHSSSSPFHHSSFSGQSNHHLTATGHLANDEKYVLVCAALFFLSFFVAIYVETKARDTLYSLFMKFLSMNQTYYITEYDHGQSTLANNVCTNNTNSDSSGDGKIQQQLQQQQAATQQQHILLNNQQQTFGRDLRLERKSSQKS